MCISMVKAICIRKLAAFFRDGHPGKLPVRDSKFVNNKYNNPKIFNHFISSSSLSSRNQRKEAKKKIDLREGGFYEDIALMRVLHLMYNEVHEFTKEVREVCLVEELNDNKFCRDIHMKLINLQKYMGEKIDEIWPEVFYKTTLINDSSVQIIIQNKNDLGKLHFSFLLFFDFNRPFGPFKTVLKVGFPQFSSYVGTLCLQCVQRFSRKTERRRSRAAEKRRTRKS